MPAFKKGRLIGKRGKEMERKERKRPLRIMSQVMVIGQMRVRKLKLVYPC